LGVTVRLCCIGVVVKDMLSDTMWDVIACCEFHINVSPRQRPVLPVLEPSSTPVLPSVWLRFMIPPSSSMVADSDSPSSGMVGVND